MTELTNEQLAAALIRELDPYDVTSHGPNPWTLAAAMNVLRIKPHVDASVRAVGGYISSCYRCPRVNKAVGGSSKSRHMEGLAVDIHPMSTTPEDGAFKLWHMACGGKLGDVHQVIWEPTWIHIGWHRVGERGEPQILQFDGKRYQVLR